MSIAHENTHIMGCSLLAAPSFSSLAVFGEAEDVDAQNLFNCIVLEATSGIEKRKGVLQWPPTFQSLLDGRLGASLTLQHCECQPCYFLLLSSKCIDQE